MTWILPAFVGLGGTAVGVALYWGLYTLVAEAIERAKYRRQFRADDRRDQALDLRKEIHR